MSKSNAHDPEQKARDEAARIQGAVEDELADDDLEQAAGGVAPGGCWEPPTDDSGFDPLGGDIIPY